MSWKEEEVDFVTHFVLSRDSSSSYMEYHIISHLYIHVLWFYYHHNHQFVCASRGGSAGGSSDKQYYYALGCYH